MTSLTTSNGQPPSNPAQLARSGIRGMAAARGAYVAWKAIKTPLGPRAERCWENWATALTPRSHDPEVWLAAKVRAAQSRWSEQDETPDALERALEVIPSDEQLAGVLELAREALDASPSETAISQVVNSLVAAYYPGRTDVPPTYPETLIDLAYRDRCPPAVVAEAREALLRSDALFPPKPGQFVTAYEDARAELVKAVTLSEAGLQARRNAVEILRQVRAEAEKAA